MLKHIFKKITIIASIAVIAYGGSFYAVQAVNYGAGNYSSGLYSSTISDTTPPVISALSSGTPTTSGTTITWTTDEVSDSQVEYGPTASYGTVTTLNSTLTTSHSITLTGLSPSSTYHFRVISKDASNNTRTSSDQTFTTDSTPTPTPSTPVHLSSGRIIPRVITTPSQVVTPPFGGKKIFTMTLSLKKRHAEVLMLQQYLNTHGFLVAKTGPGSPGKETNLFGPATKAALIKFQKANKLSPDGVFGPKTRAVINK